MVGLTGNYLFIFWYHIECNKWQCWLSRVVSDYQRRQKEQRKKLETASRCPRLNGSRGWFGPDPDFPPQATGT